MGASAQGSIYSEEQVAAVKAAVVASVAKGIPITHAAEAAAREIGCPAVHSTTLLRWRKRDPDFDAAMADAVATGTHRVLDIGRQAAITQIIPNPGSVSATTWLFCMINLSRQARSGDTHDWQSVNRPSLLDAVPDGARSVEVKYSLHNGHAKQEDADDEDADPSEN